METATLETQIRQYLDAFAARDVDKCVSFFGDQASIDFQNTLFRGTDAIRDWHKDRFAANLQISDVQSISVEGNSVKVDIVATSDRLAAWRINALNGSIRARWEAGKIQEAQLSARMTNIFDMLRSDS